MKQEKEFCNNDSVCVHDEQQRRRLCQQPFPERQTGEQPTNHDGSFSRTARALPAVGFGSVCRCRRCGGLLEQLCAVIESLLCIFAEAGGPCASVLGSPTMRNSQVLNLLGDDDDGDERYCPVVSYDFSDDDDVQSRVGGPVRPPAAPPPSARAPPGAAGAVHASVAFRGASDDPDLDDIVNPTPAPLALGQRRASAPSPAASRISLEDSIALRPQCKCNLPMVKCKSTTISSADVSVFE
jgi:hypothetical protein